MKRVFDFIEMQKAEVYDHPLIRKRLAELGRPDPRVPIHRKFDWLPAFIHLSMTFRDINEMYLRYPDPKNEYERAINEHVDEDSGHYRYMLHDLEVLGFDEPQSMSESIMTIWSERSVEVRKYIYSVLHRVLLCGDDPFLRAAVMQAQESSVGIFFGLSKFQAHYFEEQTGVELHYLGSKHADGEEEHPLALDVFTRSHVSDDIVEKGIAVARAHFESFREFLDFKESVTEDPDVLLSRWPESIGRPAFRLAATR
jgi:hypothetical protein